MELREVIMVISLAVIMAGWLVTHYLSKKKERYFEAIKWQKSHLDNQLSSLYGPIYGLLLENDRHRKDIEEIFGRSIIFEGGNPLSEEEQKIWLHYLENYYLPNNRKIVEVIKSNIHLLQGTSLPKSFINFIDYTVAFEASHKQYKDLGRLYGFHSKMNFPVDFQKQIINEISELKKQQWNLVGGS